MSSIGKLLWLCIWLAAPAPARASAGPAPARARALAGHDHDHPVCDEIYRNTVCPEACDADTLRDKCCIHEGEVATLLTVAMEAQSRAIAPRVERFEKCTGGHVELVPLPAPPQPRVAADAAAGIPVAGPVFPVLVGPGVLDAAVVDAVDRAELAEPAPGDDAAAK